MARLDQGDTPPSRPFQSRVAAGSTASLSRRAAEPAGTAERSGRRADGGAGHHQRRPRPHDRPRLVLRSRYHDRLGEPGLPAPLPTRRARGPRRSQRPRSHPPRGPRTRVHGPLVDPRPRRLGPPGVSAWWTPIAACGGSRRWPPTSWTNRTSARWWGTCATSPIARRPRPPCGSRPASSPPQVRRSSHATWRVGSSTGTGRPKPSTAGPRRRRRVAACSIWFPRPTAGRTTPSTCPSRSPTASRGPASSRSSPSRGRTSR